MIIRKLSNEETKEIRTELKQRLLPTVDKLHPYWYPLFPVHKNIPVIAFDSDFVAIFENIKRIRNIFIQHNVSSAIELQEFENARLIENFIDEEYFFEKEDDLLILPYMSECFWFDANKDWMIYVSHESTIAFEGEWLVNAIKDQLEDYSKYEIKNFIPKHKRNYD